MFQYACGLAQARRLGTELQIDRGKGENINSYRPFNLSLFNIKATIAENVVGETVRERYLNYDSGIDSRVKDGDILFGFWQSEKYFKSVADEVRDSFVSVKPGPSHAWEYGRLIHSTGDRSLMIGIRRDDYVNKPKHAEFHGVMPMSYYTQGIEMVRDHLKQDPVLFIFTDDPDWVKQNWDFGFETHYFIGERTLPGHVGREDVDLALMSFCNSAIIANGTFHWWGAWLGERPWTTGIRIAPKQWFKDPEAQAQTGDIVPDRWIKL
jgi:hypothetical protein